MYVKNESLKYKFVAKAFLVTNTKYSPIGLAKIKIVNDIVDVILLVLI